MIVVACSWQNQTSSSGEGVEVTVVDSRATALHPADSEEFQEQADVDDNFGGTRTVLEFKIY